MDKFFRHWALTRDYLNCHLIIASIVIASGVFIPWVMVAYWLFPLGLLLVLSQRYRFSSWMFGVLLGMVIFTLQQIAYTTSIKTLWQSGRDITIKVQIMDIFMPTVQGGQVKVAVQSINGQKIYPFIKPNIRLFIGKQAINKGSVTKKEDVINQKDPFKKGDSTNVTAVNLGDIWQFRVRLSSLAGRLNETGFDSETYYLGQRLHGKANVQLSELNKKLEDGHSLRKTLWLTMHSQITQMQEERREDSVQPRKESLEKGSNARFIFALAFGDRSGLSEEDWQNLRGSGLAHLMAISGLHIGFAFAIGWGIGFAVMRAVGLVNISGWLSFSRWVNYLPFVFALALGVSYAYLAGFSLPTQRAFIFGTLFISHRFFCRHISLWQILIYATFLILAIQPFAVLQASFWLSFGAVIIIYFALWFMPQSLFRSDIQHNNARQTFKRKGIQWIYQFFIIQLALMIGMAIFSIHYWQGISLISIVSNFLVIPWVGLVTVPLLFLNLWLLSINMPSSILLAWLDVSIQPISYLLERSADFWLELPASSASFFAWLALFLLLSRFIKITHSFITICVLIFIFSFSSTIKPNWQIKVLDVGQGLAVLIGRDDQWVLYDTGSAWGRGSMASAVIAPVLTASNAKRLQGLIISHGDLDHAGGRDWLLEHWSPDWFRSSELRSSENSAEALPCKQGETWQWQGLSFEVLWPPILVKRAYNPHSCVIKVSDGRHSIMLTGDIDEISERLLIRQYPLTAEQGKTLQADILFVPHHGSKSSSHLNFIKQISPNVAIVSASKNNQWGLPAKEVKQRYINQGIKWFNSADSGQITIDFYQDNYQIKGLRSAQYVPWYRKIWQNTVE